MRARRMEDYRFSRREEIELDPIESVKSNSMDKTISLERCVEIINDEIYNEVQETIDDYRTSSRRPAALRKGEITFEAYLKSFETDGKQKTQTVTKFLQYWFAEALSIIINRHNLPIVDGCGSGEDYAYVGNSFQNTEINEQMPIEYKSSGGQDGDAACLGNLGVNVKCELTLISRYRLEGNRISERQTVTIGNSAAKWKEYNKAKFDPKTGESKSSNYSSLKCKNDDYGDIVCYSGKVVKKQVWVHFIRESIE